MPTLISFSSQKTHPVKTPLRSCANRSNRLLPAKPAPLAPLAPNACAIQTLYRGSLGPGSTAWNSGCSLASEDLRARGRRGRAWPGDSLCETDRTVSKQVNLLK